MGDKSMKIKPRTSSRRPAFVVIALCLLLLFCLFLLPAMVKEHGKSPCATVQWEGETVPCPFQLTEQVHPFFGGTRFVSKIDDGTVQWVDLYILKDGVLQNTEGIRKNLRASDTVYQQFSYRLFPDSDGRYEIYAETDGENGFIYQYCIFDMVFGSEDEADSFCWRSDISVFDNAGTYLYTIQRSGPDPGNLSPPSIVYEPSGSLFGSNEASG